MSLNLADFSHIMHGQGLVKGTVYTFTGRTTANLAADLVRQETRWVVEWVGPQQFMVY